MSLQLDTPIGNGAGDQLIKLVIPPLESKQLTSTLILGADTDM